MTALATALGLQFSVTQFWRVELVDDDRCRRSAVGDFFDHDEALEACWALNGFSDPEDCEEPDYDCQLLEDRPNVKAEVVGPYELLTVQLGRKDGAS